MNFDLRFFKEDGFTFIFQKYGFGITKIYKGKNNSCKCQSDGKYYEPTNRSFKKILKNANNILKRIANINNEYVTNNFQYSDIKQQNDGYINIPIYDEKRPHLNQCYCVYFKKDYYPHYIGVSLRQCETPFILDEVSVETLIKIEKDLFNKINKIVFEFENFDEAFQNIWQKILIEVALNNGLKQEKI